MLQAVSLTSPLQQTEGVPFTEHCQGDKIKDDEKSGGKH
jgi:hypothetical protein